MRLKAVLLKFHGYEAMFFRLLCNKFCQQLSQSESIWLDWNDGNFRYSVKASFKLTKQKTHESWIAFGWCAFLLLTSTKLLVQNATTFEVASLMFQSETNWGFGLNPCEICLSNVRTYTLSYLFSNKIWNLTLVKKNSIYHQNQND
jgi:hypothetical protein